jgi:beta-lactamase class D
LGKFFRDQNTEGCFALLDNKSGEFTIYNLSRYRDSSYLPASTFKIVNSLIGLQTGKIENERMVIPWDGVKRWNESWNKDLPFFEAFRVSAVPYFQEVARRIGKDTMQKWLDSLSYGARQENSTFIKHKITSVDSFWLDHSLKVRPDEQLGLVKRLYFNQLPFFKRNMEIVKAAMLFEDKPDYKLYYKTGWGNYDSVSKKHIGWIVGWIEENTHPYFFVLNLESKNREFDMVNVRMKILKDIFTHLGFLKGKK